MPRRKVLLIIRKVLLLRNFILTISILLMALQTFTYINFMRKQYWELLHTIPYDDNYHEFIRLIGVFSSKKKATDVVEILRTKP